MTRSRVAVLVSGSGTNLQALLDRIDADADFGGEVVVVGSDQPDATGLARARQAGIPTVATALADHADRPSWERDLARQVADHAPDVVVLAGFMRVLTSVFLSRWPDGVVNVHPSLLPAFRGAHAVQEALDHGVKVTGCTVHLVDELVDHGPIIAQQAVEVSVDDDVASLHRRIQSVEHDLLPRVVKALCRGEVAVEGRRVRLTRPGPGVEPGPRPRAGADREPT